MNTTDGFKMALEMSKKGDDITKGLQSKLKIDEEEDEEEYSDEDMRMVIEMSKREEE